MKIYKITDVIPCYRTVGRCEKCKLAGAVSRMPFSVDENMEALVIEVLEPVCEKLGNEIVVFSGFRCPLENRRQGGSNDSPAVKGEAVEIAPVQDSGFTVLDLARERYGEPIKVNSGYRCEKHNREVGGASQSQHLCQGGSAAADIAAVGLRGNDLALENLEIVRAIVKNGQWDQMILEDVPSTGIEPRWIHVSWKRQGGNRKEILKKVAGRKGYLRLSRLDMAQLMSE